jgi:hypothetical protein
VSRPAETRTGPNTMRAERPLILFGSHPNRRKTGVILSPA